MLSILHNIIYKSLFFYIIIKLLSNFFFFLKKKKIKFLYKNQMCENNSNKNNSYEQEFDALLTAIYINNQEKVINFILIYKI